MQDYLAALVISILGALGLGLIMSRYRAVEGPLLIVGLIGHVGAGAAQVLITDGLYGTGDIFGYAYKGELLAAALRVDFQSIAWELLKVLFRGDGNLPVRFAGIGSGTGSMTAIAAFITYLTNGGVYTGCILFGIAGFFGKLALYEVFRQSYPESLHRRLLIATILVPSVIFWSSGLLKESVAMVGLGPLMLGVHRILGGRPLSGVLLTAFGAVTVALVKPYILFAFVVAAAPWIYTSLAWKDRTPRLRPVHLALGLAVAIFGITALGKIFPQFTIESLADQAALKQEIGQLGRGASTYELVAPAEESTLPTQLGYAPIALFTSLYRPLLYEARNAQILVNALETATLLVMSILAIWRVSLRSLWATLVASPLAVFSLVFVVVFGVAVGLTTTNLGTLSRYRMPLVPYFASLLVVLLNASKVTAPLEPQKRVRGRLPLGTATSRSRTAR